MADLTVADEPNKLDLSKGPPRLLEYPPEIREMILSYAVSVEGKRIVKSKTCNPPPLSQVSRQLRHETTPVFFSTNTFHFATVTRQLPLWIPIATPSRLSWLALDLETSIMFFHTLTSYLLQPTKILDEDVYLTAKEREGNVVMAGGTVLWGTRERIIESLAKNPRPYPFLTSVMLEKWARERKAKEEERLRKEKEEEEFRREKFEAGIMDLDDMDEEDEESDDDQNSDEDEDEPS